MSVIIPRLFEEKRKSHALGDGEVFAVEICSNQQQKQYSVVTTSNVLVFILKGQKIVHLQEKELMFEAGSLLFIEKGSYLFSDLLGENNEFQRLLIFLGDSFITDFVKTIPLPTENLPKSEELFSLSVSPLLQNVLDSMKTYISEDFIYSNDLFRIKIQEILFLILESDKDNQFLSFLRYLLSKKENNIVEVISEHLTSPLTIAEFAKLSNRSTKQFTRDFKKIHQLNPKEWITQKRLEHAYLLITQTGMNMTEVSSESGFENYSNFIQLFRKRYKITPKQLQLKS